MKKSVVITGSQGGIGRALMHAFRDAGFQAVGIDRAEGPDTLEFDLANLGTRSERERLTKELVDRVEGTELSTLVNNAAIQIAKPFQEISASDWEASLAVNVSAPFFLAQVLLPHLEKYRGNILNIGSIHSQLTKPNFLAYATSKAALEGLTRAMSVELGARVRVNAICPGAVSTPMLEAGFESDPGARARLDEHHPTGKIGAPDEVAALAVFLSTNASPFLNGAVIAFDGGISSRLHDPN